MNSTHKGVLCGQAGTGNGKGIRDGTDLQLQLTVSEVAFLEPRPTVHTDAVSISAFLEKPIMSHDYRPCDQNSAEKRKVPVFPWKEYSSPDVSMKDLLVVARPARLDPRPSRSSTSSLRTLRLHDQQACSHCLVSGQKGSERN